MIQWVTWSRRSSQPFCPLLPSVVCPQSSSRVSKQHGSCNLDALNLRLMENFIYVNAWKSQFARISSYGFCRAWRKPLSISLHIMIIHTWLITSRKITDATRFQESPRLQFLIVLPSGGILIVSLCLRNEFLSKREPIQQRHIVVK